MKRTIGLLLLVMLLLLTLSACGEKTNETAQKASGSGAADNAAVTVEETVLLQTDDFTATLKDFGEYQDEEPEVVFENALIIEVENRTDKTVVVGLDGASVNDFMMTSILSVDVKAGQTKTFPAFFEESKLSLCAITEFSKIEFRMIFSDVDSGEAIFESDPITVKTSAFDSAADGFDETGTAVMDQDGIKVLVQDVVDDPDLGVCVKAAVKNDSDKRISVMFFDAAVNEKPVEVFCSADVFSKKRSVDLISFDDDAKIKQIRDMTLKVAVQDLDTGDELFRSQDPVKITF